MPTFKSLTVNIFIVAVYFWL